MVTNRPRTLVLLLLNKFLYPSGSARFRWRCRMDRRNFRCAFKEFLLQFWVGNFFEFASEGTNYGF